MSAQRLREREAMETLTPTRREQEQTRRSRRPPPTHTRTQTLVGSNAIQPVASSHIETAQDECVRQAGRGSVPQCSIVVTFLAQG